MRQRPGAGYDNRRGVGSARSAAERPPLRRRTAHYTSPLAAHRLLPGLLEGLRRYGITVLWAITSILVALLCLRFAMRFVGVRQDVPFPGLVYGVTAPLVAPFYGAFPASERFDFPAVEAASLVAAGAVVGVALLVYVVALVGSYVSGRMREDGDY
jgi:uncharacterized protein YggT (Ycf19 family)